MDVSKIMKPIEGCDLPPKLMGLAVLTTAVPSRLLPKKHASAPTVPTELEVTDPSERGVFPDALVGPASELWWSTWRGVTQRGPVRWGWQTRRRTSIGGGM